jgi:hypothetical protein
VTFIIDLDEYGLDELQRADLAANGVLELMVGGQNCIIHVDGDAFYIHAARFASDYPRHEPCPSYAPWQYREGWLTFEARGKSEYNPFATHGTEIEALQFDQGYRARANLEVRNADSR